MSRQFYCKRPGGIHRGELGLKDLSKNVNDELVVLEGSAASGPWYNESWFKPEEITKMVSNDWIAFMGERVE